MNLSKIDECDKLKNSNNFFSDRMISHISEWYGFLFLWKPKSHFQRVLSKLVVKSSITKDLLTKSNMIWICWRPEFSIFLSILADMQLTGNVMYVPLKHLKFYSFKEQVVFSQGYISLVLGWSVLNHYFPNCVYGITLGCSLCNIFVMLCFNHLLFYSSSILLLLVSFLSTRNKSFWLLVNLSVFCPP